jgi:hypothetical protein
MKRCWGPLEIANQILDVVELLEKWMTRLEGRGAADEKWLH